MVLGLARKEISLFGSILMIFTDMMRDSGVRGLENIAYGV